MGTMFTALFAFFTQLFSAAERGASALNHIATWADEAAGTFEDEARHNRNERVKAMMKEANITELPKAAPRAPATKLAIKSPEVAAPV
jgi:hypothetical protein